MPSNTTNFKADLDAPCGIDLTFGIKEAILQIPQEAGYPPAARLASHSINLEFLLT